MERRALAAAVGTGGNLRSRRTSTMVAQQSLTRTQVFYTEPAQHRYRDEARTCGLGLSAVGYPRRGGGLDG